MFNTHSKIREFKLDNLEYLKALYDLMKPRVMSLSIFTCVVGLLIAPSSVDYLYATFSIIAVALGSGAAGALNCWYESDLDSVMSRTCLRPIPTGKLTRKQALVFGTIASFISVGALYFFLHNMVKEKNSSKYCNWWRSRSIAPSDWMVHSNRRYIYRTNYFISYYFYLDTISFLGPEFV